MTDEELIAFAKENLVYNGKSYTSVEEARAHKNVSPIVKRYGAWAVTNFGVECLTYLYRIEANRCLQIDWDRHVQDKTWPVPDDYQQQFKSEALLAIDHCRNLVRDLRIRLGGRYRILRRDNFLCQRCGRSGLDGTILEVDHKIAQSRGGSNQDENLWTLCDMCNRGKSDSDL